MSEPKYFRVKNWDKFQHYKGKRFEGTVDMPWLKLYRSLINSADWVSLKDAEKAWLIGILCIANKHGFVENDASLVQVRARLRRKPDLKKLALLGFIEFKDEIDVGHASTMLAQCYIEKSRVDKKHGVDSFTRDGLRNQRKNLIEKQLKQLTSSSLASPTGGSELWDD